MLCYSSLAALMYNTGDVSGINSMYIQQKLYIGTYMCDRRQTKASTDIYRIKTIRIDEECFVMYSHVRPKRTNDVKLDEIHTWWYMTW